MPSNAALKTDLYCPQCGNDKPANELQVLFAKFSINGEFERIGRYCIVCMPGEIRMEKGLNQAIETRTEPFIPNVRQEKET